MPVRTAMVLFWNGSWGDWAPRGSFGRDHSKASYRGMIHLRNIPLFVSRMGRCSRKIDTISELSRD